MTTPLKTIVFITGANTGIGLETVKQLLLSDKPYHILFGSRDAERGAKATESLSKGETSTVEQVQIDVTDDASIGKAAKLVEEKYGRVDVLINNAGASFDLEVQAGKMSAREGWAKTWDVNVTGAWLLTEALAPFLIKSDNPRLLFLTSGTASCDEAAKGLPPAFQKPPAGWPKPAGWSQPAYRSSKAGLNMMMLEWCRILKEDKVKIWAISPGLLATGLAGIGAENLKARGAGDPSVGGIFIKDVIEGKRDEDAGKAIRQVGVQPW